MSKAKNGAGPLENILTFVGAITGAMQGYEQSEWTGSIIGAVVLGALGKWIGAVADWILQLAVLLVLLLLHASVRQMAWDFIQSIITA